MDTLDQESMDRQRMQTFCADTVIMREGEVCDAMYKILSGSVAVYVRYAQEDEHLIGIYSKGRCFGEMSMLSEQPGVYTVVAYDDVLLVRITKDFREEFIRNNPRNAVDIMKNMGQTLTVMQKNIDLLLDDLNEKQDLNKKRTQELRDKIRQYRMNALI
ncbi:MAG: cyclic nucleotide-binding domain-containing protein [Lachnospiraceae bacterium]|nr:cyclic nucleotide-binding domain-containing protein [Lachnospiraceae bacterium]